MVTIDATTMKNRLGEAIDNARREPVLVTKSGRKAVVLLSVEQFERFEAMEDAYWSQKAMLAEQSGYIGEDESRALLNKLHFD